MKHEEQKSEGSKEQAKPNPPPSARAQPAETHRLEPSQNQCTGWMEDSTRSIGGAGGRGTGERPGQEGKVADLGGKSQLFFGEVVPRPEPLVISRVTSWGVGVEEHRNPKQMCSSELQGNILKPDIATIASFGRFAHEVCWGAENPLVSGGSPFCTVH